MAAAPAAGPIAPGVATTGTYPQWGVGGGTPGSSAGWKTVEASDAAQKTAYAAQGYLIWFSSAAAAQNYLATEENPVASGASVPAPSIPGLSQIGSFFGALTSSNTWIRVVKVITGGLLLVIGLVHITGATGSVAAAARKVPLPA